MIFILTLIVCSRITAACSPEAKYKYRSIVVDDVLLPGKPIEETWVRRTFPEASPEKVPEKTDLYPVKFFIEKLPTDRWGSEVSILYKERDSSF